MTRHHPDPQIYQGLAPSEAAPLMRGGRPCCWMGRELTLRGWANEIRAARRRDGMPALGAAAVARTARKLWRAWNPKGAAR